MGSFDSGRYGSAFADLLSETRLNPLDEGSPNSSVKDTLDSLTIDRAFEGQSITDPDMALGCLAAVWMYHNFLDVSHRVSQKIDTETGSFWHGIMHRREPDFSNSKYWFRKVGSHPTFAVIRTEAAEIARDGDGVASFLNTQATWDPFAFVDLCESALSGNSDVESICREIQQREWELLFDYSFNHAIGA